LSIIVLVNPPYRESEGNEVDVIAETVEGEDEGRRKRDE